MSGVAWTVLAVASGVGAAALGWLVYGSKDGLRGLTAGDAVYQSPDGQLHYTPDKVFDGFERLGEAGRARLMRCWRLGIVFLLFFGMVLAAVTRNVANIRYIGCAMYALGGMFTALAMLEKAFLYKACVAFSARRITAAVRIAGAAGIGKWAVGALWVAALFINLFVTAAKL